MYYCIITKNSANTGKAQKKTLITDIFVPRIPAVCSWCYYPPELQTTLTQNVHYCYYKLHHTFTEPLETSKGDLCTLVALLNIVCDLHWKMWYFYMQRIWLLCVYMWVDLAIQASQSYRCLMMKVDQISHLPFTRMWLLTATYTKSREWIWT